MCELHGTPRVIVYSFSPKKKLILLQRIKIKSSNENYQSANIIIHLCNFFSLLLVFACSGMQVKCIKCNFRIYNAQGCRTC